MQIPENCFLFINIFIILLYIAFIVFGYKKGFIFELVSLVYTAVSLFVAWLISPVLANLHPIMKLSDVYKSEMIITKIVNIDQIVNTFIYFVLVFIALKIAYIVISLLVKSLNKVPVLGIVNKICGALLGIVNATLVTLVISILFTLPLFKNGQEVRKNTVLCYVDKYSNSLISLVVDNLNIDIDSNSIDFDASEARDSIKEWLIKHE
ncbi:MAG: CvpA family protein [Erysipelotrichaceae bacterium]|nr:CvpA family protein [Erysipelotrichaceae bacterium]